MFAKKIEEYEPSGYIVHSIFNDYILCTYTIDQYLEYERAMGKARASIAEELCQENEAFYIKNGTTCDILPDTNQNERQWHIVFTGGEHNGTECWTSKSVVLTSEDIETYLDWEKDDAALNHDATESVISSQNMYNSRPNSFSSSKSASSSSDNMKIVSDSDDDYWYAVTTAQTLVKERLKSPSTAKFPLSSSEYIVRRSGDRWIVTGYVDAQNSYGAVLRQNWKASFNMGSTKGSQYGISNYSVAFE